MNESGTNEQTAWHSGLMLALLAWLAAGLAYNRTFVEVIPPGNYGAAYDCSPLTAMALRPIAGLAARPVAEAFFAACVVFLLLGIGLFARSMGMSLNWAAPVGIMIIVGFQFAPTILDFRHGQLDLLLLMLLCAVYQLDKHDRPYRMAAAIAVAAAIHVWMIGLLFYLLLSRRVLAFLFGLAVFAGGVALVAAHATWRHPLLIVETVRGYLAPEITRGTDNQSLIGAAYWLLWPYTQNSVLLCGAAGVGFVAIIFGLAYAAREIPSAGSGRGRLLIGLSTISILLMLPYGKRAYFVLLLPALWSLLTDRFSPPVRGGAMVVYALLATTLTASMAPFMYVIAGAGLWCVMVVAAGEDGQSLMQAGSPLARAALS